MHQRESAVLCDVTAERVRVSWGMFEAIERMATVRGDKWKRGR